MTMTSLELWDNQLRLGSMRAMLTEIEISSTHVTPDQWAELDKAYTRIALVVDQVNRTSAIAKVEPSPAG